MNRDARDVLAICCCQWVVMEQQYHRQRHYQTIKSSGSLALYLLAGWGRSRPWRRGGCCSFLFHCVILSLHVILLLPIKSAFNKVSQSACMSAWCFLACVVDAEKTCWDGFSGRTEGVKSTKHQVYVAEVPLPTDLWIKLKPLSTAELNTVLFTLAPWWQQTKEIKYRNDS